VTLIEHFKGINNWDLVDSSASIVGHHASIKDLLRMSHSSNLWERRMSMVATQDRARRREPEWTFTLAEALIADRADLIQKAVGWMLREVEVYNGLPVLEDWLEGRYRQLGRTALRYALEHFPADRRAYYMAK
jgi:3-methyladenine DNA glycosylase AlkD